MPYIPQRGNEYQINPETGLITVISGPDVGQTVDTVSIGGTDYYLSGITLYPSDNPDAPTYPLGRQGPSILTEWVGSGKTLTNQIARSSLNAGTAEGRAYGVSGSVSVLMADGSYRSIDIPFAAIGPTGQRLYISTTSNGMDEYNYTDIKGTNADLQYQLKDTSARFATPTEAAQRAIYNWIRDRGMDLVEEYRQLEKEETGRDLTVYEAILAMIPGDLSNMSFGSNLFVSEPGSVYRVR